MEPLVAYVGLGATALTFIGTFVHIGKIWRTADETALTVATMAGKLELLRSEVSDHKVEVARNYATNTDLERAIDRLESTLRQYLDAVTVEHRAK